MTISRADPAYRGLILLIFSISLANFMSAIDGTIVTVALPTISHVFDVSPGVASWVITSYILVMAGCVLIFGKVSDVIGFKTVFLSGFLIFTIGSFAAGFLPGFLNSFPVFIISRIFQAVGASMITAIGPAMVTAYIPMEFKGKAMGTVFTIQALGGAIGPTAGGILTQHLSWSWIFFINIPIGIGAILLGAKVIPEKERRRWIPGFDRTGAVLIFTALSSMLFFLSEGQTFGWTSPIILGAAALTVLSTGFFVKHELSFPEPLLELRLFREKNFLLTNSLIVLLFFNFGGVCFLLPFYLQYLQEFSPSLVGLVFSTLSIALMLGGILAGVGAGKVPWRWINGTAGVLEILGYFLITQIQPDSNPWFTVLCLALVGAGAGLILTSSSSMIMNSVSKRYQGMISSFTSLERFIPMMLGVTIFNILFVQGISSVASAGSVGEMMKSVSKTALESGFGLAFWFAFLLSLCMLVVAVCANLEIHPDYQKEK